MTIDELISTLQTIRDEHGNIDIAVADYDQYGHYDGTTTHDVGAMFCEWHGNQYVLIETE